MAEHDFPILPNFYANTKYKKMVNNIAKCIIRGHMTKLQRIMKAVKLIKDVEMQTTIFNTMLAICIAEDQMDLFICVVDQPEVDINVNIVCTKRCVRLRIEMPILSYAFVIRRNRYARLLLEHSSMLLLNDLRHVGALPVTIAIKSMPLDTKYVVDSREEAEIFELMTHGGDIVHAWSSEELEDSLRLIELMIKMGAHIANETITLIERSPYKDRLLELTKRIWSSKSVGAEKSCANCLNANSRKCSRCNLVYYCSVSCQKVDYEHHKEVCKSSQCAQATKERKEEERKNRKCNYCDVRGVKLRRCGKCTTAYYCSTECQHADWNAHKLICEV